MERRRAVAVAAATTATGLAAVAAVAANFGLLGFAQASPGPAGRLGAGQPAAVVEPAPIAATPATVVAREERSDDPWPEDRGRHENENHDDDERHEDEGHEEDDD